MNKLILKGFVEKKIEDGILDVGVASSSIVDRYGEIVDPNGMDAKNFKKNPVFLWSHNAHFGEQRPPIGKVMKLWNEGKGKSQKIMFKVQFDMEDEFARDIARKYGEGFLNAFSIGFRSIEEGYDKDNVFVYNQWELLEISAVPVPANPEALVSLKEKGMRTVGWEEYVKTENELKSCERTKTNTDEKIAGLVEEIQKLREDIKALTTQDVKKKPEPKDKDKKVTEKDLQDVLRIVNQATSIALKQIKENYKKGGE